tara:strand:+ start:28364 stop:28741 length:378 start_codon:yes stop_codon:yes gene_type:complete
MLVSGVLTATMFYGAFSPESIVESMFGVRPEVGVAFYGELELMVVRSWSALIGLVGVMLVVGFINPKLRRYSLSIAAASKLVFVTLSLLYAQAYWQTLAPALIMDSFVVLLALLYLCIPSASVDD